MRLSDTIAFVRYAIAFIVAAALVGGATVAAQDKQPPQTLVFRNKGGDVTFTHASHISRENGECATCHDKLWPQSTAKPLANSTGCKTCHLAGGKAFEMKGNCVKCHPGAAGKNG
jgi:c(7)-type cytochrome triheme protein